MISCEVNFNVDKIKNAFVNFFVNVYYIRDTKKLSKMQFIICTIITPLSANKRIHSVIKQH